MVFVFVEQSDFRRHFFMIAHKFSIGFRSGELPGQFKTINLTFLKKVSIFYDVWQGALSSWKIPFPSGNDCCIDGTNFVSNISWYLVEFIIPSIGHNLPVPLNVKHPQNIFFGGCFRACWM